MPEPVSYTEIGRRLREARDISGLSQEKLGEMLTVKGATVSRYESADSRVPIPDLVRIAEILESDVYFLITGRRERYSRLTEKERRLLELFRCMSPEEQEAALVLLSRKVGAPIPPGRLTKVVRRGPHSVFRQVPKSRSHGRSGGKRLILEQVYLPAPSSLPGMRMAA